MVVLNLATIGKHLRLGTEAESTLLTSLCDGVEDWCQAYLGVRFSPTTVTDERVDGGGVILKPTILPVDVTQTVVIKDSWSNDAVFDADDYYKTAWGMRRNREWPWLAGGNRWLVSYTGGYANATAVPPAITAAMMVMVHRQFSKRNGAMNSADTGVSFNWSSLLSSDEVFVLDRYRMGAII